MKSAHVILSFNKINQTIQCLSFLIKIVSPRKTPIFLVHNGSHSGIVDELQVKFPEIHHIVLENNFGFTGGANHGLNEAFCYADWVYFHTNDTETLCLPEQLPPNPSLLAPMIKRRNQDSLDSLGAYLDLSNLKPQHFRDELGFEHLLSSLKKEKLNIVPYIPGTAFLIHRDVFQDLGGFDQSFHTYWEDIDFSYRLYKKNPQALGVCRAWVLKHKIGRTCHKDPFYTQNLFPRNRELFRAKHNIK